MLGQDIVLVTGGNTANALAIWRVHSFDRELREAWERGVVLTGWSAGMICWFEHGVTDSLWSRARVDGVSRISARQRLPALTTARSAAGRCYNSSSVAGLPAGLAADDGVALHFVGTELHEVVTSRPGATAYRVGPAGERPLTARLLG